jgi:hypothetical protein
MKIGLMVAICLLLIIALVIYSCCYTRNRPVTAIDVELIKKLALKEFYRVENSPIVIKLLQINTDEKKCLLEISNSDTNQKTKSWVGVELPNPEVEEFLGKDVLRVNEITNNSVSISLRKGYIKIGREN